MVRKVGVLVSAILVIFVTMFSLPVADAQSINTSNTVTVCAGSQCKIDFYDRDVNMLDSNGNYVLFDDLVSFKWDSSNDAFNLSWDNGSVLAKPYFMYSNNVNFTVTDVRGLHSGAKYDEYIVKDSANYKFGTNFSALPVDSLSTVDYMKLRLESMSGLEWKDVKSDQSTNTIKFSNGLQFSFDDVIDSRYTIKFSGDNEIWIGNLSANMKNGNLFIDPTISLSTDNTHILEDALINESYPDTNYGSTPRGQINGTVGGRAYAYFKYNISMLPQNISITEVVFTPIMNKDQGVNYDVRHVYNQTWCEDDITFNHQPCGAQLDNNTQCNTTPETTYLAGVSSSLAYCSNCFYLTYALIQDYNTGNSNFSFVLNTSDTDNDEYSDLALKEYPVNPILSVTYNYLNNPTWYDQVTDVGEYNPGGVRFNITWNTTDTTIDNVTTVYIGINWSGSMVNYTMTNTTDASLNFTYHNFLAAGAYQWESYGNTSDAISNFNIWNQSDQWVIVVQQNTSNPVHTNISDSIDSNVTTTADITLDISCQMDYTDSGSYQLWVDDVLQGTNVSQTFGEGGHTVLCNTSGNGNYTSNATGMQVNINVNPAPVPTGGSSPVKIETETVIQIESVLCGDGICSENEDYNICSLDCKAPIGESATARAELAFIAVTAIALIFISRFGKKAKKKKVYKTL